MDSLFILRIMLVSLCTTVSSSQRVNGQEVSSPSVEFLQNAHYFFYQRSSYPKNCQEVQRQCPTTNSSGVYLIKPDEFSEPFEVFCNHNGGWTVILRRENGVVNFNRSWTQYREGFGFLSSDFWIGNEKISYLTNQASCELRVDLQMSSGEMFFTTFKGFRIADEFGKYSLLPISAFKGNPVISTCPRNMEYGTCICQATCDDPNGESGCHGTCSGDEGCVCPAGFALHGTDCIHSNECGCFMREANMVIPNGETHMNNDCTRRCTCNNNQINCEDIFCNTYATCDTSNGVRQCICNNGFEGDGHITCDPTYTDCKDVYNDGNTQDGVYTIMPSGWTDGPFPVYCKMDNGGGWTVFQKRGDGRTDFYRSWNEYKQGFGDLVNLNGDFWLGNDKLYYLTNQRNYKLRFDVTTSDGSHKYGEYTEFQIESENTNYKMNKLGSHNGTTGQVLYINRGKQFSTRDRDNDACNNFHCAEKHRSGWWHTDAWCSYCDGSLCRRFNWRDDCYTTCTQNNLNGDYSGGIGHNINTRDCSDGCIDYCNLPSVEMKIRPLS